MSDPWRYAPEYAESLAILAAQVDGPYRVIQHALVSYVRVAPAEPETPIVIRSGPRLSLMAGGQKLLYGAGLSMDLVIHFIGTQLQLREMPYRIAALEAHDWLSRLEPRPPVKASRARPIHHHPEPGDMPRPVPRGRQPKTWFWAPAQEVPEGGVAERPRPKPKAKPTPKTLILAPEPTRPEVTIPRHLEALCQREDLHPELGDYLVIPPDLSSALAPLPPWVAVTTHVDALRTVKPRLGR